MDNFELRDGSCFSFVKSCFKGAGLVASAFSLLVATGATVKAEGITIGFGKDKPPFVTKGCSDGIEVRLAAEMFKRAGLDTTVKCMTNKRMIHSYVNGDLDAGVTVPNDQPDMFYTSAFTGFENFAISRKADNLQINSIADLGDKSATAWNNAAAVLGDEFKKVMEGNPKYKESSSQISQVKKFLSGRTQVVIIDKTIFLWLTKTLVESGEIDASGMEFTYHPIFPGTLDYYVGFSNKDYRDRVEAALSDMRTDGTYDKILGDYLAY